jgi:hypothetical protein
MGRMNRLILYTTCGGSQATVPQEEGSVIYYRIYRAPGATRLSRLRPGYRPGLPGCRPVLSIPSDNNYQVLKQKT